MSISKFRDVMEHSGCRVVLAIMFSLIAAAFVFGSRGCANPNANGRPGDDTAEAPIATVGDYKITRSQLEAESQQAPNANTTAAEMAQQKAQALDNEVTRGLDVVVANQNHVGITDQDVLDLVGKQFEEQMMMTKLQLQMNKKIPENATDQQFQEAFKKMYQGKSPDDLKKSQIDSIKKELDDPDMKKQLYARAIDQKLMDALKTKINVTDEDLKHVQDSYTAKRIFIDAKKHPKEDAVKKLQGILADIKAKKITFEQAMDQYTDDTPGKGKKPEENIYQPDYKTMKVNPEFTPILSLKAGEMTDVIPSQGGAAVYRLDSIQSKPDPNFDKNKVNLRNDYVESLAATELNKQQEAARSQIKWDSPGYQVLYDWFQTTKPEFQRKSLSEQKQIQDDILKRALAAAKGPDPRAGEQAAWLAAYAVFDPQWTAATADEKKKLEDQRTEIIRGVLSTNENVDLRLKLIDAEIEKKEGKNATEDLQSAADANSTDFSLAGQQHFQDMNARLAKLKAAGLITPEKEKPLEDSLNRWRTGKTDYDKQMAEQKKREEEDRKKAAEEQKKIDAKAAEEAAKQAAQAKANAPKPTPGPLKAPTRAPVAPQINLQPGGTTTVPPGAPKAVPPAATTGTTPPKGK